MKRMGRVVWRALSVVAFLFVAPVLILAIGVGWLSAPLWEDRRDWSRLSRDPSWPYPRPNDG